MKPQKIKVIFNDDGPEPGIDSKSAGPDNIVQVKAARDLAAALEEEGFNVDSHALKSTHMDSLDALVRTLQGAGNCLVFNLCEAAFGKSSYEMHIAALFELYGVRYTGNAPLTLGLALNKGLTKDILYRRDIMTPEYCVMTEPPSRLKRGLKFPLIVKPLREDASVGIDAGAVVTNMKGLKARVDFIISNFQQPAIVEEYIDGREFNVAVLGNGARMRALPPSEIDFVDFPQDKPRICCYEAKWDVESPLYKKTKPVCPANVTDALRDELQSVACKAYEAMGCRDYARVDARLGEDGNIKVLEVNPNPDISTDAGLARAGAAIGLNYSMLVSEIARIAMARYGLPEDSFRKKDGRAMEPV
ncbi:MAG: ATP-grasp domain-containing protein [Deltaproteobacteria bacterium]|nr:ATP-grasp domain-containing protein [Deltaproteobacteria bacterium]